MTNISPKLVHMLLFSTNKTLNFHFLNSRIFGDFQKSTLNMDKKHSKFLETQISSKARKKLRKPKSRKRHERPTNLQRWSTIDLPSNMVDQWSGPMVSLATWWTNGPDHWSPRTIRCAKCPNTHSRRAGAPSCHLGTWAKRHVTGSHGAT